eukprot:5955181-Prymnesium_polylepis.4
MMGDRLHSDQELCKALVIQAMERKSAASFLLCGGWLGGGSTRSSVCPLLRCSGTRSRSCKSEFSYTVVREEESTCRGRSGERWSGSQRRRVAQGTPTFTTGSHDGCCVSVCGLTCIHGYDMGVRLPICDRAHGHRQSTQT